MRKSQIFKVIKMLLASGAVLLSVGCAVSTERDEEAVGSSHGALTKGAGSSGFICGQSVDGTIGCVCNMGTDDPIMSCNGMMTVCDLIGPGMICDMDDVCSCIVWGTRTGGKGEDVDGAIGLAAIESLGIKPQTDLPKGVFEGTIGDSIDGSIGNGVATKPNIETQIAECIGKCETPDRVNHQYCNWFCECTVMQKKDRMTCEAENPYVDVRETPPLPPLKEIDPGTVFLP
jgi:hypothetical protein